MRYSVSSTTSTFTKEDLMDEENLITLAELKRRFSWFWDLPDDTEIFFGSGDLTLYRAQGYKYGPDGKTATLVNIEFNEVYSVAPDPNDAS